MAHINMSLLTLRCIMGEIYGLYESAVYGDECECVVIKYPNKYIGMTYDGLLDYLDTIYGC